MFSRSDISTITDSALTTWLWSETDHDGTPLDYTYGIEDITPVEAVEWLNDVTYFVELARDNLKGLDLEQIGHDFTLTRNGHGAGFWDRGLGDVGVILTEITERFGEKSAYVGDDNLIGSI